MPTSARTFTAAVVVKGRGDVGIAPYTQTSVPPFDSAQPIIPGGTERCSVPLSGKNAVNDL